MVASIAAAAPAAALFPRATPEEYAVPVRLDDPLRASADEPTARTEDQLLALLSLTELLLKKELAEMGHTSKKALPREVVWPGENKLASETLVRVENLVSRLRPAPAPTSLRQFLEQRDELAKFFPRVALRVCGVHRDAVNKGSADAMWAQSTLLNDLIVLASQLGADATQLTNHKYMAHQVALLYQNLNAGGQALAPYKAKIEKKFDELKKATNQGDEPQLSPAQKDWLVSLTHDVIAAISALPPALRAPMQPALDFLGMPEESRL